MAWIDSRELNERLDELEAQAEETLNEETGEGIGLDDDESRELAELRTLRDEVTDWQYGATLIPENDFEDYARQLADEIMPSREARELSDTWPFNHIDWEAAADALKVDYSEVEYQGTTYLVRG